MAAGPLAGTSHSGGRTTTTGTSSSRTWGTSWSEADGTSWSDAAGRQRVYEFAVEPTVLQGLPDHALLVADRSEQGLRPRMVECDPDIAGLCLPGGAHQSPDPRSARGLRPPPPQSRPGPLTAQQALPGGSLVPRDPPLLAQPLEAPLAGARPAARPPRFPRDPRRLSESTPEQLRKPGRR
jgi:hypothetical protein